MRFCAIFISVFAAGIGAATAVSAAETPQIKAPDHTATINVKDVGRRPTAEVDGWSCGPDITEDSATILTELSRRKSVLTAQIEAGQKLIGSAALKAAADRNARQRMFDKVAVELNAASGAPFRFLSLRDIDNIRKFKGFREFTHHDGSTARFRQAGIGDQGTTAEFRVTGCYQTTDLRQIEERLRASAKEVLDLNREFRDTRRKVADSGE